MQLTEKVKKSIEESVLCWLATVSSEGVPNVSPKEVFTYFGENTIIIANIASPQSVRNIKTNPKVCVSFIEIFIQKGFQIKGTASIATKMAKDYEAMEAKLLEMTAGKFPFHTITSIEIDTVKPIIAPKYILYPETTEEQQIESAKKSYGITE